MPQTLTDLCSFLGSVNFLCCFIPDLSAQLVPLTAMTKLGSFHWSDKSCLAFENIKNLFSSPAFLAHPDSSRPFVLECDASDFAYSAQLLQEGEDGVERSTGFFSAKMNDAQLNYPIYDKEMLAIIIALREWRQYLLGTLEDFEIWTDHKNLEYFRKPQDLNRRQARWVTMMQDYHFTLHHKPGKQNAKADYLSRRADHERGVNDNKNITLLKPEFFAIQALEAAHESPICYAV